MLIEVIQADLDKEYYSGVVCEPGIEDQYTWDSVDNPVSQAVMRTAPNTSCFTDYSRINVYREKNYWFKLPAEVLAWLTLHAHYTYLRNLFNPSTKDREAVLELQAKLLPFSFELELPDLTPDDIEQAKARIAAHHKRMAELV